MHFFEQSVSSFMVEEPQFSGAVPMVSVVMVAPLSLQIAMAVLQRMLACESPAGCHTL